MRIKQNATALNSDRCGVSDHATAVATSGVLQDIGIVTKTCTSKLLIDIKLEEKSTTVEVIYKTTINRISKNNAVNMLSMSLREQKTVMIYQSTDRRSTDESTLAMCAGLSEG
ncbi:hypothetical protein AVEN_198165-1 [Araneus ventricosus]|uniref:Uncharacterized protein n=1 Tax=Araneus ventricosus TaxID=182803 RepID=A0A4Y2GKE3_ARAVE|nr:hypothetical protein AVEN_198165-1 [Araneus ventricosus]